MSKTKTGAGQYRHFVKFQKNEPTTDAARGQVDVWVAFCERRGKRPAAPATREEIIPDANRSVIHTLTMMFRSDSKTRQLTSRHRAIYQNQQYEIESVSDPDGLAQEVQIVFKVREIPR